MPLTASFPIRIGTLAIATALAAVPLLGQKVSVHSGGGRVAAQPSPTTGIAPGRSVSSINHPGTAPPHGVFSGVGVITDLGFASRLGATVAAPGVALPGSISNPGLQPLPTTVQPRGRGPIGSAGGAAMPPRWDPTWDGRKNRGDFGKDGRGHGGRRFFKRGHAPVIYYGIPYYAPYATIYTVQPDDYPAPEPVPADAAPYGAPPSGGYPQPSPEAPEAVQPQPEVNTILVFKDRTVVTVRDYWLEGDRLWYHTTDGVVASMFLDQLDLPFTQQLNRERGVRFVLESRP
jgi:hypothetical protein